jgi:tetratricopeptide (TPR) repeat protein
MIDEQIKEFLDQQKTLIEKLSKSKTKDRWDKLAILSTFLSSIVIAAIGIYFTSAYKAQEVRVSEAQVIEKLVPHLSGTSENAKKGALLAAATLGNNEMAARLGALYASPGTIEALEILFRKAKGEAKDLLEDSLIDAYFNRGLDIINTGGYYEDAIRDYNKIFKLKDEAEIKQRKGILFLSDCYLNRGVAYDRIEDYGKAVSDYEKSLQINPNYWHAYLNLGMVFGYREDSEKSFVKALEYLNKAEQYSHTTEEKADVYLKRGNLYSENGDISKAIGDYGKYISIKSDDYVGYYKRAIAYEKNKDFGNAETDLKKAQRLAANPVQQKEVNGRLKEIGKQLKRK